MYPLNRNLAVSYLLTGGDTVDVIQQALARASRRCLRRRARVLIAEVPVECRRELGGRPIEAVAVEVAARLTVSGTWARRTMFKRRE